VKHSQLLASVTPLVRRLGPYGMLAASLLVGALAARRYLGLTRSLARRPNDERAIAQWDTDGGSL
jgi:hypothetical protein